MTTADPNILVERARAGDLAAASELLTMFYQSVFAYLRRLCANEQDAADLTQKTFAKGWQSLGSYEARSRFSTWLHGIAYHVYVDWRRQHHPADAQTDAWWEARVTDGLNPFEDTADRELAHQVYRWVDQLDEEKKQTVHLHYYQGLSLQETAETLGIAASTVKYRLREALDFLRAKTVEPACSSERKPS